MAALAQLGASAVTTVDPEQMEERIVLVAFQVKSGSQMHAQTLLMQELAAVNLVQDTTSPGVVCWWVAMDERYDRSDNDSAVFCTVGQQLMSQAALIEIGTSGPYNLGFIPQ